MARGRGGGRGSDDAAGHVPAGTPLGSILRETLASGEASLPPCDELDKQRWLAEVGYSSGRAGTARLPYLAVCKLTRPDRKFLRLTDYDRWLATFPLAAHCGRKDHTCKYLEDVLRAEGLERQFMDICARLALCTVRH